MEKTWRWFGKNDKITLPMLRQIGVEGIVTALHEIPNGEVWPLEAILNQKTYIETYGLRWSVVESLPVSEAIKYGGAERDNLIENYKKSLINLGKAGVKTVCYNFMPVIDWIRTDLEHLWEDETSSLYFDKIRFAYFDCLILQRAEAEKDYTVNDYNKVTTKKRNAERYSDRIELQGFQSCFRLFVKPSQSPLKPNQDAATLLVRNHARNGDKRTRITKQGVKD